MNPTLPSPLFPGDRPTWDDYNALLEYVRSIAPEARPSGFGGGDHSFHVGTLRDHGTPGHWARITGGTNPYSHVAVAPVGDGTWTNLPATADYEFGTTTSLPANEANARADVPAHATTGAVVWLEFDPTVPGYRFLYGGVGAVTFKHGVLDGDLARDGTATLSVYADTGSGEADTTENITVRGRFVPTGMKLASGARCGASWNGYHWYAIVTDTCPVEA